MPNAAAQQKSSKRSSTQTKEVAARHVGSKDKGSSTLSRDSKTGAFVAARNRLQGVGNKSDLGATGWKLSKADAIKAARLAGVMTASGKLSPKYK